MAHAPGLSQRRSRALLGAVGAHVLAGTAAGQSCFPHWSGEFAESPLDGAVYTLEVYDDGTGPALAAGGAFRHAAGSRVNRVARWDGARWWALGAGVRGVSGQGADGAVHSLRVFDDGAGPGLFAGGEFGLAGAASAVGLARWRSGAWAGYVTAANPVFCSECPTSVRALAVHDDGTGPSLHVTGYFDEIEGVAVGSIAAFDGREWAPLGLGLVGSRPAPHGSALAVLREQGGTGLIVGGLCQPRELLSALNVARWSGGNWSAMHSGLLATAVRNSLPGVHALLVADVGDGRSLYAGGSFSSGVFERVENLARWTGQSWVAVGGNIDGPVNALEAYDDGGGPALYVGGRFSAAGGVPAQNIARWDGSAWAPLTGGADGEVFALKVCDPDGAGPVERALYVAGDFAFAGGVSSRNIAAWRGCRPDCYADCDTSTGRGVLDIFDLLCFQSRFAAGAPYACDCDTSTGPGVCDAFDLLCFQGRYASGCP